MYDSGDDGLCGGDSNSKKIRWGRRFLKSSKKVRKKFKCGCCDRGLGGAVVL